MPEAPGTGGAEKTKAVLGMMHKTQEPDPACPCSPTSWPARPQVGEEWVGLREMVSSFCVARARHQDVSFLYSAQAIP